MKNAFQKSVQMHNNGQMVRGTLKTIPATSGKGMRHATITINLPLNNPTVNLNIYSLGPDTPSFVLSNLIITRPGNQTQIDADFINTDKNAAGPLPSELDLYCDFIVVG